MSHFPIRHQSMLKFQINTSHQRTRWALYNITHYANIPPECNDLHSDRRFNTPWYAGNPPMALFKHFPFKLSILYRHTQLKPDSSHLSSFWDKPDQSYPFPLKYYIFIHIKIGIIWEVHAKFEWIRCLIKAVNVCKQIRS